MLSCPNCTYGLTPEMAICTKCMTPSPYFISPLERQMARVKTLLLQGDVDCALRELRNVEAEWTVIPYKGFELSGALSGGASESPAVGTS